MQENIENLYDDIKVCVSRVDDKWLNKILSQIKGNTLCVGSGGSKVVANFANIVLTKKNKIVCKTIDARDLNYIDLSLYDHLLGISYEGKNTGIKLAMMKGLDKYLLTGRKTKISDEKIIHYEMPKRHSFISLNTTVVPMAILLKYYLGDEKFFPILDKIFAEVKQDLYLDGNKTINIFTGIDTEVASNFLESTFIEAGLNIPIIHYKYDYCHGRSTINKNHQNDAIYLGDNFSDLDEVLKDALAKSMHECIILKRISDDDVINSFYLVIQALYLVYNMAKRRGIDLAKIKYDKDVVKDLYYFKGGM